MNDSDVIVICSSSDDEEPLSKYQQKYPSTQMKLFHPTLNVQKKTKPPPKAKPASISQLKDDPGIVNHQVAGDGKATLVLKKSASVFSTKLASVTNPNPNPNYNIDMDWTGGEDLLDIDCIDKPRNIPEMIDEDPDLEILSSRSKPQAPLATKYSTATTASDSKSKAEQKKTAALERKLTKEKERKERLEVLEREKALKKAENELRKNETPGEAHKFITVMADTNIPNLDSLQAFLIAAEIKHELCSSPHYRNSITFKRELVYQAMGDNLKLQKVSKWVEEDQILIVLDADEFVSNLYVQIHRDDLGTDAIILDEMDSITLIKSIQMSCPGKSVTLMIYGMDKYFKKMKTATQREFRDRVCNQDELVKKKGRQKKQVPVISQIEFQSAMVELQLETQITYRLVNNSEQLGKLLISYLRAVADAPFKRQRKELGFDWFAAADSAGSVKVEKDGKGLTELWTTQLRQFENVGSEIAEAIVKIYPTPSALLAKYAKCKSSDDALDLLREINVWTGVGPLAKQRRVGPELSKKIYRFCTSREPERCLGSSHNI